MEWTGGLEWTGALTQKIILMLTPQQLISFMTIANGWASKLCGGGVEAKVACQRFDGAAPYALLDFTFWEQRLAVSMGLQLKGTL